MLKKKLHIALKTLLCCFICADSFAQISLTIPNANITGQTDYTATVTNGTANALFVLGTISVRSTTANFPATTAGTTTPLALGVVLPRVNSIGGISLLAGSTEVTLSTSAQTIYTAVIALSSGSLLMNYKIKIAGTAWLAGTYATPLAFTNTNPLTQELRITVPSLLSLNTLPVATTNLSVNNLAAFRTGGGVSATNTFDYFSTVPTDISLKSTGSNFSFNTTQLFNSSPTVSSTKLSSLLSGVYAGSTINLSTTDQVISTATSVPVVLTNKNTHTNSFGINAVDLKANFIQAGTYSLPVVYTVAKKSTAFPLTLPSITMNSTVQLNVAKITELTIPTSIVNLSFTSAAAYNQGLTVPMPNPVTASSTVPYNITVKSSGNFISGANSIPAGVITVEGVTAQTGITPVVLSTTAQNIISGADPVIDRTINLQFRVPNTQTINLLNKPAGTYKATVTFTMVAP